MSTTQLPIAPAAPSPDDAHLLGPNHRSLMDILRQKTPEEEILWREKLAASRKVEDAEAALQAARRALTLAKRISRKADHAFEQTPTGAKWIGTIRRQVQESVEASIGARAAERRQPLPV